MPGGAIDFEHKRLTLSQSLAQDFQRCPQRAYFALTDPKPGHTDATAVGQGLHTFMELRLAGETYGSASRSALSWLDAEVKGDPHFRFVKVKTLDTMTKHLRHLIDG